MPNLVSERTGVISMTVANKDFFIEIVSVRFIVIRSKPSHKSSCGRHGRLIQRPLFELKVHGRKTGVSRNEHFPFVDVCQFIRILKITSGWTFRRDTFSSDG